MAELEIKDLHVTREGKEILKGVNLKTGPGEVHAIMGPNGSGKSTTAKMAIESRKEFKKILMDEKMNIDLYEKGIMHLAKQCKVMTEKYSSL